MRDQFYSDNRDLVKWAVLYRLGELFEAKRILQIAFYRPSKFSNIVIDGKEHAIPQEVLSHFRDLRKAECIGCKIQVKVFKKLFKNRDSYLTAVKNFLSEFCNEKCVVFLDPDIGLESNRPSLDHVLESEARAVWEAIRPDDVFVFYQHQTDPFGKKPWIELKQRQLESALNLKRNSIKVASGFQIARDVVFFYAQKS